MITRTDLTDRAGLEEKASEASSTTPVRSQRPPSANRSDAAALRALEERIAEAKRLKATFGDALHCGHCWGEGRDAAIRLIEGPTEG